MVLSSLTVLFPSLNEARTLGYLVAQADNVTRRFTGDYEILVIDDGSTDGTALLLTRLKSGIPSLHWIPHPHPRGPGGAIRSGLAAASKEWIFTVDADGQFDVAELARLVENLADGVEMVSGHRSLRTDSVARRLLSGFHRFFMRGLLGIRMSDPKCSFRLIRRRALDSLVLRCDTGLFWVELTKRLEERGCHTVCVPIHVHPRRYGRSRVLTSRLLFRAVMEHLWLWRDLKRA